MREFTEQWEDRVYESDLKPEIRTLIDLYHNVGQTIPDINRGFVDIEIQQDDLSEGFPDSTKAIYPITGITLHVSKEEKFYVYLLKPTEDATFDCPYDDCVVKLYDTEDELLLSFVRDFSLLNIDLVSGWNSESFDFPYVINRVINRLGEGIAKILSSISIIDIDNDRKEYKIAGLTHLDYMLLYKKFVLQPRESYSLDYVCRTDIKRGKREYSGHINELWRGNFQLFGEYNIDDVRLLVDLDKRRKLIKLSQGIAHKGNVPYDKVLMTSIPIDGAIITWLKNNGGAVVPNGKSRGGENKFQGAYVADPKNDRLWEWVVDKDAKALYPSTIKTLNIDPTTKLGKFNSYEDAIKKFPNAAISANFVAYDTKKVGIIPNILTIWGDSREHNKGLMFKAKDELNKTTAEDKIAVLQAEVEYYDMQQNVDKTFGNSCYGYLGLPSSRFYDIDNAEATTLTGQAIIKTAVKTINDTYKLVDVYDHEVLYVDTDSCIYSVAPILNKMGIDLNDENACIETIKNVIDPLFDKALKKAFDKFAKDCLNVETHHIHFKGEWIARRVFFVAKKRYGLFIIDNEGVRTNEKRYMGLDVKRSAYAKYYKQKSIEVFDSILDGEDEKSLHGMIGDVIDGVRSAPLSDISNPQGVKKVDINASYIATKAAGVHNKVIKDLNLKYDSPIMPNSKIKWVYLKKDNPFGYHVIAFTEDSSKELLDIIQQYVDYDVMIEKNIDNKLKPVLEVCNMRMPEKTNAVFKDYFSF